ncbi:MAG: LPXTG cell wall anchor domain-containing protein [Bellilinea sp.]
MTLDQIPPEEPEHNQYDEFRDQYEDEIPTDAEEPKAKGGRTFITIVGVIGAVVVLAVIALVIYFLISKGQLTNRFQEQAAQINANNTATAMVATQDSVQEVARMTEKAILPPTWTPTSLASSTRPPSATPRPTNTTIPTATPLSVEARTATVVALLTQPVQGGAAATQVAQITSVQTTQATSVARTPTSTARTSPTALPTTGFADDIGLPGIFGLALALILIVFLVRRIRFSTNH